MNEATLAHLRAKHARGLAEDALTHSRRLDRALASWQNLATASAFARGLGNELPLSEVFAAVGLADVAPLSRWARFRRWVAG